MKIIHGSLKGLLEEVIDRKVETVRVAALMESAAVANGIPLYTSWIIVTAPLDWDRWAEWRLLVGRGRAEMSEDGAVVPERIAALMEKRIGEVRARVQAVGLGVRDGIIAHDTAGMDGVLG